MRLNTICGLVVLMCGIARSQTNQVQTPAPPKTTNQIVTLTGKVYDGIKITSIDPDGLMVEYHPAGGGVGISKIKFSDLSESERKKYGYNPESANKYEQAKKEAQEAWAGRQIEIDDKAREAKLNREIAEQKAARENAALLYERIKAEAAMRQADAAMRQSDAEMFKALNPPQTTIINQNQNVLY